MDNGWDASAAAWIAAMGEQGDWGRQHVLDPAMLERVSSRPYRRALDVGCGEGRFCRMLAARGVETVGIDPTATLLERARTLDPEGAYLQTRAEELPLPDASFDLVVSYLTLIDIADFRQALREMARVLTPGGTLLIANLNGFVTGVPHGWIYDQQGRPQHYPVDRYMDEHADWVTFRQIRIENWHRPLSAYMRELLSLGLELSWFDEPAPRSGDTEHMERYRRVPWFHVMQWEKPP